MARHPLDGSSLDADTLNLWWGEYWTTGHHTSGGATLDHIHWHLTGSAHKLDPAKCRVARYIPVDSIALGDLRLAIIDALLKGQTCVVYLGNAKALTYNERNVEGHFVALGGVDSDQGYLVGNGDDVNALGGKGIIPCRWYGWNMLEAAKINGMIALERVAPVAAPAGLGGGFSAMYTHMGMTARVTVPETYFNDTESVAVFSDGTVFYYNAKTGECSADTTRGPRDPYLINALVLAWQAAKNAATSAPAPDPTIAAKAAKYDAIKQALA
jgi:hypothetical protein